MRVFHIAVIAVASGLSVAPAAQAQTQKSDDAAVQTFTGCLMTEPAYRRAHNLGSGAVGGVGLGDEFVLVDVTVTPAKESAVQTDAPKSSAAVRPSGAAVTCADRGVAYRLTGTAEEKIKGLVGRHLEVQGRFKHSADAAAGGTRPSEKLPAEVEIVSFREAPAPAMPSDIGPAAVPPSQPRPLPPPPAVDQPRASTPPARTADTTEPHPLPKTASSMPLLALIGVLLMGASGVLAIMRRRSF